MNLNLRETPTRQLIERRDELMAQVDAINREVQRRAREQMERQRTERTRWEPKPRQWAY